MSKCEIRVDVDALEEHRKAGHDLIPLYAHDAQLIAKGKPRLIGKQPRHKSWQERQYDPKKVIEQAQRDNINVGRRLGDEDVVIDYDIRRDPKADDPDQNQIAVFARRFELDLLQYSKNVTGAGGAHISGTKPAELRIRGSLPEFPALEFKTKGQQVLCAGCVHPETKRHYEVAEPFDGVALSRRVPFPTAMLDAIARGQSAGDSAAGIYTNEQIKTLLDGLDPCDFGKGKYDKFRNLAMAVHHASGGSASDEFQKWCSRDPDYSDCTEQVGQHWDSFSVEGTGKITYRTLNHFLIKAERGDLIPPDLAEDFAEETDDSIPNARPEPFKFDMTKLPEMLDHAEKTMLAAGVPLYQTGGRMVHPVRLDSDCDEEQVRRKAGAMTIRDISPLRLREYIITHVPFYRVVKSPKTNKPTRLNHAPPLQLANHLLAREDKWGSPVLNGVIEAPTLRRDGSLLDHDGYDRSSGLLLDKGGVEYPAMAEHPARADAMAALEILKWPLKDFPFVANAKGESASRSVMLSAVLTALVRRTLHSAPLHGTSAPTMGTGKTLLQDVVSMIATGRLATAMSQGANEEEDEKRLFSVLLQNDLILLIDNVKRPIEGDALCTILTQASWQSRILGENRKVSVATNALILASGNNLTFKGDMTTRALVCRVDAGVERPETRRFDVDLKSEIPRRRPELVTAGLTILRAFVCAGRPGLEKLEPFGRFEEWSNLVRGALVWLGEPDPCKTRAFIATDDPERNALAELLQAMIDNVDGWNSAGEIIKAGDEATDSILGEAILNAAPKGSREQLGRFLRANEGRIVEGLRLQGKHNSDRKLWEYRVRAA